MAHIPEFPPIWRDWAPGNPFELEPPFPRFTWNPLTPEQMAELESTYGRWAARRTLAMISPSETFETAKRITESMYESYKARALAWLPPAPPKVRRERKPKAAPEFEELEKALKPTTLTPEIEANLIARVIADMGRSKKPLTTEYQMTLARSVMAWAETDYGLSLTEEQAVRMVKEAARQSYIPAVVVRDKAGRVIRWETAAGVPVPEELWPAR
jgi:hypothetical protein